MRTSHRELLLHMALFYCNSLDLLHVVLFYQFVSIMVNEKIYDILSNDVCLSNEDSDSSSK